MGPAGKIAEHREQRKDISTLFGIIYSFIISNDVMSSETVHNDRLENN